MRLQKIHYLGIGVSLGLIILNIAISKAFGFERFFFFFLGIAILLGLAPFLASLIIDFGREKEKEEMFLEFCRNLVESVSAGTPIPQSILNVTNRDYGSLTSHIKKLSSQITLGIPIRKAFQVFSDYSKNKIIQRSIRIITEAEESGGEIGSTLESVAKSVSEVEDIKKERKASLYNQVLQGYIIYLIFIGIMLILQIWLLPLVGGFVGIASLGSTLGSETTLATGEANLSYLNAIFFILILVEGLFTGFVIGKLSEGSFKAGIKHAAILTALAYLIVTGVRGITAA